jgi:hypothetical protein
MPTDKHIYNGCKNEIVLIKLPLNATYTGQGYRQRVWAMKIASSLPPHDEGIAFNVPANLKARSLFFNRAFIIFINE